MIFLNYLSIFDWTINTLSNMQLNFTSRENWYKKNVISLIHKDNITKELIKY